MGPARTPRRMTPRRILLVGAGGREHALAIRLAGEPGVTFVLALPGSDAIASVPGVSIAAGDPLDPAAVVAAALGARVDLAVIGPEAPLAAGVTDALVAAGIPTFGPSAAAARIESSKAFCHELADAAGVRMAHAGAFAAKRPAVAFAAALDDAGRGIVIKADGLAAGKGVTVCETFDEALAALDAIFGDVPAGPTGAPRVVVEERLRGPEASVIVLADETAALALPAARDHKRLGDGDAGPNTGGMGAYSPLPDLPDADVAGIVAAFHVPLLAELARRGTPFRGALYAGLILADDGPVLLECNARLRRPRGAGHPAAVCHAARAAPPGGRGGSPRRGRGGGRDHRQPPPGEPRGGRRHRARRGRIPVGAAARRRDHRAHRGRCRGGLVFHAGTARDPDGTWRVHGGRVLTVVGTGPDLAAARAAAELAADAIAFEGLQRRHDIAATTPAAPATAGRPR
jgi:phosphoribosylamine--glycine ligase